MLVLTRKVSETVVIDQDIRITVTKTKGGKVQLAIQAPDHIKIRRAEIPSKQAG